MCVPPPAPSQDRDPGTWVPAVHVLGWNPFSPSKAPRHSVRTTEFRPWSAYVILSKSSSFLMAEAEERGNFLVGVQCAKAAVKPTLAGPWEV